MSIWKYPLEPLIAENDQLTLNEGSTNLDLIETPYGNVWAKREDLNPTGSFKDRSLSYQLSYYVANKQKTFVISSSGNAAISAAALCKKYDLAIQIYVPMKLRKLKKDKLEEYASNSIRINYSERPKSDAIKYANEKNCVNLRGSVDDLAMPGYESLAYELAEQLPEIEAIYSPTSSGTSILAINNAFQKLKMNVAMHICQSQKLHPISEVFDPIATIEMSFADCITDRVVKRKKNVIDMVTKSHGSGWSLSDNYLLQARQLLPDDPKFNNVSYNSLLSLAGWLKSLNKGFRYKYPVVIFSGQ